MMERWLEAIQSQLRPEALKAVLMALPTLALLAAWLYLLKPSVVEFRELGTKYERAAQQRLPAGAKSAEELIREREEKLVTLRNELHGDASGLPLQKMEAHVIEQLDQISMVHNVELVRVVPQPLTEVLMFDELPFDVNVSGDYFDLFEWLSDAEEALRPMVIKQFEIRNERGDDNVALQLRLVAYRAGGGRL